jgi:uncharacterized lipoprotein
MQNKSKIITLHLGEKERQTSDMKKIIIVTIAAVNKRI